MTLREASAKGQRTASAQRFRRPLVLSVVCSVFAESVIFVVWGLVLYPGGNPMTKFLWTVVFCGIGMGSAVGAMIGLCVAERSRGWGAIALTVAISVVLLGGVCNGLCYTLDAHYFHYFGASDNPTLFLANGVAMAAVGGTLIGWLLFTARGQRVLEHLRM